MGGKKQLLSIYKTCQKVALFVMVFFVFFSGSMSFVHAQAWSSTHEITPFQGNKPGAVSITFDDGLATQAENGASELNARGLKGTFFILPYRDEVTWVTWKNLAAQGHEIASHTVTHRVLPTLSVDEIIWELSESQTIINQNVPNQACLTISYPQTASDNLIQSISGNYYVASRGGWSAGSPNFYTPGRDIYGTWDAINFSNVGSTQGDNLPVTNWSFNRALDNIVQYHGWYDLHFHEIDDPTAFGTLLDYILAKGNVYWIDTFSNVARYMKERLNSTIQVVTDTLFEIRLRIMMDTSLPTAIYNVPLTIRSTVPATWTQVQVQQGSAIQTIIPVTENSEKVIYYNALPNGGDIILTYPSVLPNPVPSLTNLSPVTASVGGSDFTLSITGNNFVSGSVVRWNNADRATSYISETELRATILAADIASVGAATVRVLNPSPGGGLSNQMNFSITAKPITITVDWGQSKVYGEADPIFTYTSSDSDATFTGTLERTPGEAVGEYAIEQGTLAVVGSDYVIASFVPANFTITRMPAILALNDLNQVYDGTRKSVTVTTDPPGLPVEITYDGLVTAPKTAGLYTVTASVNHPDYSGVTTGILNIDRAVVSPSVTIGNKAYDGTVDANLISRIIGGALLDDDVTLYGGTAFFEDKNVGTDKRVTVTGLTLLGEDADNYRLSSTSANTTADIRPRTLTVTASGVNKVYDGTTAAVVDLGDDRIGMDDLVVSYAAASFLGSDVGVNKLVNVNGISIIGGADIGNYLLGNTNTTTTANITVLGQTIAITTHVPATAPDGASFDVAAISDSGLSVVIATAGICVGQGEGMASITMTSGTGVCRVIYSQPGNLNYGAADTVQEFVSAIEKTNITSPAQTSFDVGFAGTFTITTTGDLTDPVNISIGGTLPLGINFVDNGDGTATLSGVPVLAGVYPFIIVAENSVAPAVNQNFILVVKNGAVIGAEGIGSVPDTGNGSISENEVIFDTLGITKITVSFSQNVNNPEMDTDPKDVTNPANYMLVLGSSTGEFRTESCKGGVIAPDVSISVDSVTYEDGASSGPFIATLSINGGFPLNVIGNYRLYVCGTTSIVDAANVDLELAGDGITSGTDFLRNFRIQTRVATNSDGNEVNESKTAQQLQADKVLVPVTGFAPGQVKMLPFQPADKIYQSLGELRIEIPGLGVDVAIVGVTFNNGWDLTWLTNKVAYLEGSAYPTLPGNTVLTAHVTDANNRPGPFSGLRNVQVGEKIYIYGNGQIYVYQVQTNRRIQPSNISAVFAHEDSDWITLVTCEYFDTKTGSYQYRRMVRAILISVIPDN